MDYRITHRTIYEYSEAVTVSHHAARLLPMTSATQQVSRSSLSVLPQPAVRKESRDYFGNAVCSFAIQEIHRRFEVVARSNVTVNVTTAPVLALSPPWEKVVASFRDPVSPADVAPYEFCMESPHVRLMPDTRITRARAFRRARLCSPVRATSCAASARTSATTGSPPRSRRRSRKCGSAVAACAKISRMWPSRACARSGCLHGHVSGYLRTHPAPGRPRLVGADASHAWFSVFCPVNGWVDFDPTNAIMPSGEHITIAIGRDFSDVSPLSGILTGGGEHEVRVSVDVEPMG